MPTQEHESIPTQLHATRQELPPTPPIDHEISGDPAQFGELQSRRLGPEVIPQKSEPLFPVVVPPNPTERKPALAATVRHASQTGRAIEAQTVQGRHPLNIPGKIYDGIAEGLYHPEWYLRGILGLMTAVKDDGHGNIVPDSIKQTGGYFWAKDILRTVYEQHFPEFKGHIKGPLNLAADVVKTLAPLLQFIGDADAIGDGIMTAADIAEGKSLVRLGIDAGITAFDFVPPPFSVAVIGDVALYSPGLDRSERVLRYSLMEALFLGMVDPNSPLSDQRESIAHAVLETGSLIASGANATIFNPESSLGAKAKRVVVDDNGDVYLKILGPFRIKLTKEGQKPNATIPFAQQLLQIRSTYAEDRYNGLAAKQQAQTLTNDEHMQLAMCNLIRTAQHVVVGKFVSLANPQE